MVVVFFQIGVVSEVPVFGVNVDLSPLLVAFVGLLCGSTVGARRGFAVGLLVDLALLQTLGLTSLIFTLIGYWCGRLRELRDPQAALTPLLVGAGAAAVALVGYSLDGVHAGRRRACQPRAAAPDRVRGVVDTIVALPMWALVGAALKAALPEDPRRRRRRRAYTTGGLSPPLAAMSAIEARRGGAIRRPARLAAAGAARRDHRRRRDGDVRDHLLPPVVPAGALRRTVRAAGQRQPRA